MSLLKSCFAQLSGIDHAIRTGAVALLPPLQFDLSGPAALSAADTAQLFLIKWALTGVVAVLVVLFFCVCVCVFVLKTSFAPFL